MPDNFIRMPVIRWGKQTRYKCCHCTCYMATPKDAGVARCSRCGATYYPYNSETYAMVVPDDVHA